MTLFCLAMYSLCTSSVPFLKKIFERFSSFRVQLIKTIMKKLFIPFYFLLMNIYSHAQVAGNAVISSAGNNIYNNTGYEPAGVDLSITPYSSNFSQLMEANIMINVKATSFVAT